MNIQTVFITIIIIIINICYSHGYGYNSSNIGRSLDELSAADTTIITDEMKKKPEFFLIGAMKCGTTTLFEFLSTHPEICNDVNKEKHFFDKDEKGYFMGYTWYLSLFQGCNSNQFYLDATPRYINFDNVPIRIQETYGPLLLATKKFILILREPVSRQYSEYQMRVRVCRYIFKAQSPKWEDVLDEGDRRLNSKNDTERELILKPSLVRGETTCPKITSNWYQWTQTARKREKDLHIYTFAEWLASPDGEQEIARGHYLQHIAAWLMRIKRSQLFIVNFASLISDTPTTMTEVSKFLGLSKDWGPDARLPTPSYVKPDTILDCKSFDYLDKHYKRINQDLIAFINNHPDKPEYEPTFPEFVSNRATCKDA